MARGKSNAKKGGDFVAPGPAPGADETQQPPWMRDDISSSSGPLPHRPVLLGHDNILGASIARRTSAIHTTAVGAPSRYYPVDLPDLPFSQYEHRRLGARDIMIHRVVKETITPTKVTGHTFDTVWEHGHNFNKLAKQDEQMAMDLRTLRNMIFLTYAHVPPVRPARITVHPHQIEGRLGNVRGHRPKPLTTEDEIMDLVQRHYLEVDEAAVRQWMHAMRPPSGPRQHIRQQDPAGRQSRRKVPMNMIGSTDVDPRHGTRAYAVLTYGQLLHSNRVYERQEWTTKTQRHLLSLRPFTETQARLALYDGGASTPLNKQVLDYSMNAKTREVDALGGLKCFANWTESDVMRRFRILTTWNDKRKFEDPLLADFLPAFEPARGRGPYRYYTLNCYPVFGRKRSLSEPPPKMFAWAKLPRSSTRTIVPEFEVAYPRLSWSQIDKRSRRRSLDREHIERMFHAGPAEVDSGVRSVKHGGSRRTGGVVNAEPWMGHQRRVQGGTAKTSYMMANKKWCGFCGVYHNLASCEFLVQNVNLKATTYEGAPPRGGHHRTPPCANCRNPNHVMNQCHHRCGHCGALSPNIEAFPGMDELGTVPATVHGFPHGAPDCEVAARNRCKCVAFPTFHTAAQCPVTCSRPCGSPYPPGHFKHRNAMTCKWRCCMCGLRGHSGKECRMDRCRCGAQHLGQDCGWRPECRVSGCDRYLCGVHCRGCGSQRKPFVDFHCQTCFVKRPTCEILAAVAAVNGAEVDDDEDDDDYDDDYYDYDGGYVVDLGCGVEPSGGPASAFWASMKGGKGKLTLPSSSSKSAGKMPAPPPAATLLRWLGHDGPSPSSDSEDDGDDSNSPSSNKLLPEEEALDRIMTKFDRAIQDVADVFFSAQTSIEQERPSEFSEQLIEQVKLYAEMGPIFGLTALRAQVQERVDQLHMYGVPMCRVLAARDRLARFDRDLGELSDLLEMTVEMITWLPGHGGGDGGGSDVDADGADSDAGGDDGEDGGDSAGESSTSADPFVVGGGAAAAGRGGRARARSNSNEAMGGGKAKGKEQEDSPWMGQSGPA